MGGDPDRDNNPSTKSAARHAGLDLGINWIDTAAVYGLGHSDTVVGRAVRNLANRFYIFTKGNLVWDDGGSRISHDLRAGSIQRECEARLKRLGVDAIDLYQIHWPAWKGGPESTSPGSIEEAVAALVELRDQGKIRYIGVSNFSAGQMRRAQVVAPITSQTTGARAISIFRSHCSHATCSCSKHCAPWAGATTQAPPKSRLRGP